MLRNIPIELRSLAQWCIADMSLGENGLPKKQPLNPTTGFPAKVSDPRTWGTFDQAILSGQPIGFVFSSNDPYAVIDLDNKPHNPATPEQLVRMNSILEHIDSYQERSVSGSGYHIIVRGSIPSGVNRDHVEIYSSSRFMIFTGNVIRNSPINDYHDIINKMHFQMAETNRAELEQIDGVLEDHELVQMALDADNGAKFDELCRGDWQGMGYGSQSEADLALMSILCFYSRDNEQCRRIFRYTELGKREKAIKNNKYIDFTLSLVRSHDLPPVDFSKLSLSPPPAPIIAPDSPMENITSDSQSTQEPDLTLPPGIIGQIAHYVYASAPRPAKELAMMAALAMVAGITGRAYNISNTGLNQYFVVLAETGAGKEGMALGIDNLFAAVRSKVPGIDTFSGPSAFASGQGLDRLLEDKPCFVSVLGEFGLLVKRVLDVRASSTDIALKSSLLKLFNSSGPNQMFKGTVFSNKENNVKSVRAPNVTILGETVAGSFFSALSANDASDGFIPRLLLAEYTGTRPFLNDNAGFAPPEALVQQIADLATISLTLQANNQSQPIQQDSQATKRLRQFNDDIDQQMRKLEEGPLKHILNRSHFKAIKLAGLLAVGVNPTHPVVTDELAYWAIEFIKRGDRLMTTRFEDGEVGEGDSQAEPVIRRAFASFAKMDDKQKLNSRWPNYALKAPYVPFSALRDYLKRRDPFKNHKLGIARAIDIAVEDLLNSGILVEIPKNQLPDAKHGVTRAFTYGPNW